MRDKNRGLYQLLKQLIVAFAILFVLTGCSRMKDTEGIQLLDQESYDSQSSLVTSLTMWIPQNQQREVQWYMDKIDLFNKTNAGKINVSLKVIIRGAQFAYEDQINAMAASGGLPDILLVDGPNIGYYAKSGILSSIDDLISEEDKADFLDSLMVQGSVDKELYAIGQYESSAVLFYNKKILAEAEIGVPTTMESAWTWDQFYAISKALTTDERYGTTMIYDYGEWMTYVFEHLWLSEGTDIIGPDGVKVDGYFNSEKGALAMQVIQAMAKEHIFNLSPAPTEFEEGKAATKIGGIWDIPNMINNENLEWGVTYFPFSDQMTSPSGSWALGISGNCTDREAAASVIRFLTNEENSAEIANIASMIPNRKSLLNGWEFHDEQTRNVILDQINNTATARPVTAIYPLLTKEFSKAVIQIMKGMPIQAQLDQGVKEIRSNLE